VRLDTSPEACKAACALSGDAAVDFRFGDVVRVTQSAGRALEKEETAVICGAGRSNRIWYRVITQNNEDMEEGATYAWYWDHEELPLLSLIERQVEKDDPPEIVDEIFLSKEDFEAALKSSDWSYNDDIELARATDRAAEARGAEPCNVSPNELLESIRSSPKLGASLHKFLKHSSVLVARATLLRVFNMMMMQNLPKVPFASVFSSPAKWCGMSEKISEHKGLLFYSTKSYFFDHVLRDTSTPTMLASDEYEDPPHLKTLNVNRIRANKENLVLKTRDQRLRCSVFGQLYSMLSPWSGSSLRRSFLGKGHWGQKRAFKVKFIGEGVNDYGMLLHLFGHLLISFFNIFVLFVFQVALTEHCSNKYATNCSAMMRGTSRA